MSAFDELARFELEAEECFFDGLLAEVFSGSLSLPSSSGSFYSSKNPEARDSSEANELLLSLASLNGERDHLLSYSGEELSSPYNNPVNLLAEII